MSIFRKAYVMAIVTLISASAGSLHAQEKAPEVLSAYLPDGKVVKGNIVAVIPPEEIKLYVDKVQAAAEKDPEWYEEYAKSSKPGVPLPFHEKLGLNEEEYQKYRELWNQRKHKVIRPIELRLEALGDKWMIRFAAKGVDLTLLRYNTKDDVFDGIGGKMERIKDIESDPDTILGAWTGQEWKFEKESLLGRTKENFAIGKEKEGNQVGKEKDGEYGIIIYRLQNMNRKNEILAYENLLIRFPIEEAK